MTTTTKKTRCEELGYKVGDRFILLDAVEDYPKGHEVVLHIDDGTATPAFSSPTLGDHWYVSLSRVRPLDQRVPEAPHGSFNPLAARDRIKEIGELTESLKVEREALVNQLASEGFLLVSETLKGQEVTGEQAEDMTDLKNWRVGDLVESLIDEHDTYAGEAYRVTKVYDEGVDIRDSIGDTYYMEHHQVKWHSRPKD